MSAPVDVLAVLSAVIDGDCMDEEVMLMQTRAAVAELIEAGHSLLDGEPGDDEWERFEAALANVTGGAK